MISIRDPKDDIWKTNPFLEIIEPFKKLKKELGSRKGSKVLTAIYMIYDPKSDLRNSGLTHEEIVEDVTENYLSYKNFDWEDYKDIIEIYRDKCLSKTDKLFVRYEADLEDLGSVMEGYKYTKENAKERTDLTQQYKKLLEDYIELKGSMNREKEGLKNRADYEESLAESFG